MELLSQIDYVATITNTNGYLLNSPILDITGVPVHTLRMQHPKMREQTMQSTGTERAPRDEIEQTGNQDGDQGAKMERGGSEKRMDCPRSIN